MVRLLAVPLVAAVAPWLALAEPAPAAPAAPASAGADRAAPAPRAPAQLLSEIDAAWRRRDDPAALAEQKAKLDEAEKGAPGDYEVLWRIARYYFWMSDDPGLDSREKSRLGKRGWEYGDRATAANPKRPEGWHYAAAGVGNYALGIGVLTALRQGIEGKFRERLGKAEELDPDFDRGAIQTAWGRFWYELPWPKYSGKDSRKALEAALAKNPANVRAHVYMADLAKKENRPDIARAELTKALAKPPGQYDAPEERRWQAVAKQKLEGR